MKSYGIYGKPIKLMQAIYSETKSMAMVNEMPRDWFDPVVG